MNLGKIKWFFKLFLKKYDAHLAKPVQLLFRRVGKFGEITVIQNTTQNLRIMKRNGKTLSGINMTSHKPTSNLYLFPHITELFSKPPTNILCIGGGACVYPIYALKKNNLISITVVENDQEVINASKKYFPLPNLNFKLIMADGLEYLASTYKNNYDLIFVDVGIVKSRFYDYKNNLEFATKSLIKFYLAHLSNKGTLIINFITTARKQDINDIKVLISNNKIGFSKIFRVTPSTPEASLQDIVLVAAKQHTTIGKMNKKLISKNTNNLTYNKESYQWMLKQVI